MVTTKAVFVLFLSLASLIHSSMSGQVAKTGLNLTKVADSYYYYGRSWLSWYEAEKFCRSYGLALVALETKAKSDLILAAMMKLGLQSNWEIWTGGTDAGTEGQFRWSQTGKPFNYVAWQANEPNNWGNNENCAVAVNKKGEYFDWFDANCDAKKDFVCELPLACWLAGN